MSPHEKSARGEIITVWNASRLLKYRRLHKKSPNYRIARRKISPGRQLITGKNPSRPGGRRAERIFAGKMSTGETFLGGGDPTMGHRPHAVVLLSEPTR